MNKILVHLRAPVLTLSGYGVHARQIIDYLLFDERFEVFLEAINWGHCPYIHNDPRLEKYYECIYKWEQAKQSNARFDLSVHVSIPNEFRRTADFNIGVTAGVEVDRITKTWVEKCNEMDLILVPSEFSKKILTGTVYDWRNNQTGQEGQLRIVKPVEVIHEWYEEKESEQLELNLTTEFNFLHVGQWGNKGGFGEDRKNIADMIKLFLLTFKEEPKAGLVLKVNIVGNSEEDFDYTQKRLKEIKSNFPGAKCKVYLLHDTLTEEQMWGLYRHPKIKAFLSLTHGEGFGLPLLEAAAAGLPVIATNWSGHLDFLQKGQGFLPLDYELVDIPECQIWPEVIDKGARWAKADDEHTQKQLRKFFNSPSQIRKQAKQHVQVLQENFSKQALSRKWEEFFDRLLNSGDSSSAQQSSDPPSTYISSRARELESLREVIEPSDKEKVLYIMPRSAGDVLISTSIVSSLMGRHADADFYFATNKEYRPLLQQLVEEFGVKVIDYQEKMMSAELTSEVWDCVYNPGINVQYNFSNWLLGNGEWSVRLLEEFAKNCNLLPREIKRYMPHVTEREIPKSPYCTFSPGGIKSAKVYKYWGDVLMNLKEMIPELTIVQTGLASEKLYGDVVDARGTSYSDTLYLIKNADFHVGVDTFTAHGAAAVDTPHLIIYGSTDANTVTPVLLGKNKLQILLQTSNRHGCKNACYKDQCFNSVEGKNCISEISPETICNAVKMLIEKINEEENDHT